MLRMPGFLHEDTSVNPIIISAMAFVATAAVVGILAFVFRDNTPQTATRLDLLVGKRRREDDERADILRKTAFEGDKSSLLEMITPKWISLDKIFQQADCHIKPGTLFGIGLLLAAAGATVSWVGRLPLALIPVNAL